jgi:hypothetical protein
MNGLFEELQKIKNHVDPATRTPIPITTVMVVL